MRNHPGARGELSRPLATGRRPDEAPGHRADIPHADRLRSEAAGASWPPHTKTAVWRLANGNAATRAMDWLHGWRWLGELGLRQGSARMGRATNDLRRAQRRVPILFAFL
jgi:hypothetical protein